MPIAIESGLTDDNDFMTLIGTAIRGISVRHSPEQLWIIQIDNWFDHKWLRFSGNGSEANRMFSGSPGPAPLDSLAAKFDSVKTTFFKTKTTFPPFTPERVRGQWSFVKSCDDYVESPMPAAPHGTRKTRSGTNLNRSVTDFCQSAVFVWYSGNSLANGRGSLMVYHVIGTDVQCWYASFHRDLTWILGKTKGIDRDGLLNLMNRGDSPLSD
jgi:hypothetical protein